MTRCFYDHASRGMEATLCDLDYAELFPYVKHFAMIFNVLRSTECR